MSTESSYPSKLRVLNRRATAVLEAWDPGCQGVMEPSGLALQGPHNAAEFAARLYMLEALQPPASALRGKDKTAPYSLEWFQNIEALRHGRRGRWLPRLLEFTKHPGETLLCLGHGLGTDWVQYARHGAQVVVCSPSHSQLGLVRRNFDLRNLPARFLHASPIGLPLDSASIDVACLVGLLETAPDPQAVVDEIYRVLKPGGKVLTLTPACYDVDYWQRMLFWWNRFFPRLRRPRGTGLRFSARSLKRMFGHFVEHRIHKRHLRRADVPHVWRWLPMPMLERTLGRILVVKAFKPLSAALPALAERPNLAA